MPNKNGEHEMWTKKKQESARLSKSKDLNSYEIMRVATRKPYKKTASPKDDCVA